MPRTPSHPELSAEVIDSVGLLTLRRPQALNALTLEMIRGLSEALGQWEEDDRIAAVIIRGEGDRAFCAGGDIKATHRLREESAVYFEQEYALNRLLFHYKKPTFAFMHGITMGGGFGVAGPCRVRIATENTVFAMPETGIGFFPDVGSVYFLNRCPGHTGSYLAVTGNSIGVADTMLAGLATHFVPQTDLEACLMELLDRPDPAVLADFSGHTDMEDGLFRKQRAAIDRCFGHDTIEEIIAALQEEGTEWAVSVLSDIRRRSPLSLKVALAHLRKARGESFDQVIERDYRLALRFLKGRDFYEGIRAAVIDKDRNPRWNPDSLDKVSQEDVDRYFQS